jgi:HTH-type transcriptional regulator/antitoxin HigA
MDIRPITNDEDHLRALRAAEQLWDAPDGSVEAQELDALATLIEAYERKRWPLKGTDPIEILHYAINELGQSQAKLAEIIGSRARASEILNRKRAMTIEMIDKISKAWGIPRALLAVPYDLNRKATASRRRPVVGRKSATRKSAPRKRA